MSGLPTWVYWLQALSVPAIALAGVIIAASNYFLAKRRRSDELFDRRFAFYRELVELMSASRIIASGNPRTADDLLSVQKDRYSEEAAFLFGDDIAQHIRTFQTPIEER